VSQERESLFTTRGEQLVGRELAKDKRAGGVPHYVPGQHRASIEARGAEDFFDPTIKGDIGRVTYVDQMGHAVVVLAWRDEGTREWRATWIGSAGQYTQRETVKAPADFVLSEKMLAALAAAEERE
jgi:hypothetical protein